MAVSCLLTLQAAQVGGKTYIGPGAVELTILLAVPTYLPADHGFQLNWRGERKRVKERERESGRKKKMKNRKNKNTVCVM